MTPPRSVPAPKKQTRRMSRTPTPAEAATALARLAHARLTTIDQLRSQAVRDRAIALYRAHSLGATYGELAKALSLGRPTVIALVQRGERELNGPQPD